MRNGLICFPLALFLFSCSWIAPKKAAMESPTVPREFRAAWVATVANIDWPSKPGLSTVEQKRELLAIFDKTVDLNMNAIVLQIRPQCDAFYKSELEPWSYYLTGEMGKAPDPFYDPLEFAVKEAHNRGLELHTWFNPYRANHPIMKSEIHEMSPVKSRPNITRKLGDKGYYWLDPAMKETQDHSLAVVMDVVNRYDIDGVHFDDYFYPYPSYNDNKDFPDDESWEAYKKAGGTLSRGDWRREAVNTFIKRLYQEIKAAKPNVKFGISPFGIWRPGYPEGIKGFDQYDQLYADAKLWLNEGWVDYFTPQLYWAIDSEGQPYKPLLKWWVGENTKGRHIWPGNFTSRIGDRWKAEEIVNQVQVTKDMEGASGNVHFSMKCLMENRDDISDKLKESVYKYPVLVPASPWLAPKGGIKVAPSLDIEKKDRNLTLSWDIDSDEPVRVWVISKRQGGEWSYKILPETSLHSVLIREEKGDPIEIITLSAVDLYGIESPLATVNLQDVK